MFRKRFLVPLAITLSLSLFYCFDRVYYSDRVPFLCPIQYDGAGIRIRSDGMGDGRFGARRKNGRLHKGVDMLAPMGSPVRAAKSGWALAGENAAGYGKYVKIIHPAGLATFYAHLKEVNFKWIKRVRQGDVIGFVGKSGNANHAVIKPHLHFEVRVNNTRRNPMRGYLQ